MAVLTAPVSSSSKVFDLPNDVLPAKGTFVATCIEVKDLFNVERRKFQSEEMEKVDITAFLFGYRDKSGNPHKIASRAMKISANEKAALHVFLKSWLGEAPKMGWDYCEMKGQKALITVDHETKGDRTYANIVSLSPLPDGMTDAPAPAAPASKAKAKPAPAPVEIEDDDTDAVPF